MENKQTALYRHFDEAGRLLYVGISLHHVKRLEKHNERSNWFKDIASITIQHYPDRNAAREAEKIAVQTENPMHNIRLKTDESGAVAPPLTSDSIIGWFFHLLDIDGRIEKQGHIQQEIGSGMYLCQLYSWLTGYPTNSEIISVEEFKLFSAKFYRTAEAWVDAAEMGLSR